MKRYLVTGGAGFIGSHLVDHLIAEGHEVVVLDDFSTGTRDNLTTSAKIIEGDVADLNTVKEAFQGIDACFHLAAIASVEMGNKFWRRSHDVNSTGTVNIFEAAKIDRTPVVFASSAAVYGNNPNVPFGENERPQPQTAYGADKYASELFGEIAWNIHSVPNTACRLFNVYGPRQDPKSPYSGVISIFAEQIKNHHDITIFGDGQQVRDFIFVKDVVEIFYACMTKLESGEQLGFKVLNVCTKNPVSLNNLVGTIEKIVGNSVKHLRGEKRRGDVTTSIGDPQLADQYLQQGAKTSLEDGLGVLLRDFKGRRIF